LECQSTAIKKIDLRKNQHLVHFEASQKYPQTIEVCVKDISNIPEKWSHDSSIKYVTCY
jgi:hypothetical protein